MFIVLTKLFCFALPAKELCVTPFGVLKLCMFFFTCYTGWLYTGPFLMISQLLGARKKSLYFQWTHCEKTLPRWWCNSSDQSHFRNTYVLSQRKPQAQFWVWPRILQLTLIRNKNFKMAGYHRHIIHPPILLLFAAYVICKKNYSFSRVVFLFFRPKLPTLPIQ